MGETPTGDDYGSERCGFSSIVVTATVPDFF
jgi:hypothetical protein